MDKKPHTDHKYIEALLRNDSRLLSEVYRKYSGKIIAYVQKNSGNSDDAQDVIQETLVAIYHQAKEKNFILTCPFDAYFYLLCKRRWLNVLKKRGKREVTIEDDLTSISEQQEMLASETELFESRSLLFESKFKELGAKCQELLKLAFTIKSMEKVAQSLGVTYGYARKKKSQCIGKLTQLVRSSTTFNQLQSS